MNQSPVAIPLAPRRRWLTKLPAYASRIYFFLIFLQIPLFRFSLFLTLHSWNYNLYLNLHLGSFVNLSIFFFSHLGIFSFFHYLNFVYSLSLITLNLRFLLRILLISRILFSLIVRRSDSCELCYFSFEWWFICWHSIYVQIGWSCTY